MPEDFSNPLSQRPERIGKYEILEHIASGGMGIVYLARDPSLDRYVALKILAPDLARDPSTLERFRREARAAALLRHENIVAIYDIGEAEGSHFIALEYVDGTDLQAYINRKCRLDPTDARQLMIQATRALVHAHAQGIVHRDIKPSNFLLTIKDKPVVLKLTDFGLAIRNENEAEFRITRDKTTVGTVDYMSPEQARDSRGADIRSDIYSLGCTFYHMLGGFAPYAQGTLAERIVKHMKTPPPDVRKLNKNVPEAMVVIIQRMLAKRPDDRYQTPADLLHDLEHPEKVELPKKRSRDGKAAKKAKGEPTAVLENKVLDEGSFEPVQTKARPMPRARIEDIVVPKSDDDLDQDDDEPSEVDATPRPPKPKTKNPNAASSPIWMYASAGIVVVLGLILVLAFSMGGNRPLPKKEKDNKDGEVKVDPPKDITNTDKKDGETPPKPPVIVEVIDTSPDKMTVPTPTYPLLDLDPAKADLAALRKEYYGSFDTFPQVPEQAQVMQVRRFGGGAKTHATLAEALAQTKADVWNVIEIHDNGPLYVTSLPALSKRKVCIRGGAGYHPLLVWDLPKKPSDPKAAVTFLAISEGELLLENLHFVMKAPADAAPTIFDVPHTDFYARNCTFSLAGKAVASIPLIRRHQSREGEARKTQTWLQRCYLRGADAQLLKQRDAATDVLIEESLLVNHLPALITQRGTDDDALSLSVVRSSVVTGQVLVRMEASGKKLNPSFHGRVLDSILSRDDPTASQGDLLLFPDASDTNRMTWKAANTVYAGWKQLLATPVKNIAGQDLEEWHRLWTYSFGDRALALAWPSSPPSNLESLSPVAFLPADTALAFAAASSANAVGSVIGRLPSAPDHWLEATLEPRLAPVLANVEADPPRVTPTKDGPYAGESLDLTRIDLGAHLAKALQRESAPRVVLHLTGKGTCFTSPIRIKGVQHLVLVFDSAKDGIVLEPHSTTSQQRVPLIEMHGGHLELVNARIRLNLGTLMTSAVQMHGGHVTLSRCWLAGPLNKSAESFKSLVNIANTQSPPVTLLMRENILVSGKGLIHAQDSVQIKARNNVLVSLSDGITYESTMPSDAPLQLFDHNTFAVRGAVMQLKAATGAAPLTPVVLHATNNAFLRPFEADADKATLTRGFESWTAPGRLIWQGRGNLYDPRIASFAAPGAAKGNAAKVSLKDWQTIWGQSGELDAQTLDAGLLPRELSLDSLPGVSAFNQMDRLVLSRQVRPGSGQGFPGVDWPALGLFKKKGT